MMGSELRQKYIEFFTSHRHIQIPAAPLVPSVDQQLEGKEEVLFTSAGMQPLIPYLLGRPNDNGKRLVDYQKCLRTDDIEEVGDLVHHTFFEMLGNWSLGDYWKEEAISMSFDFLTKELNIPVEKLAVTVFAGDETAPKDEESANAWKKMGLPENRIFYLGKEHNFWPTPKKDLVTGEIKLPVGPCGPDTEMFYWTGTGTPEGAPDTDFRWVEIWNDVFMEFNYLGEGKFEELKQKNVDTGMGLERALAVLNGFDDNYKTDLFWPIIEKIEEVTGKKYTDQSKWIRRIADHTKSAVFVISDGVEPSNVGRGYVLRRLIRRSLRYLYKLGADTHKITDISQVITNIYSSVYPQLEQDKIAQILVKEVEKFAEPINDLDLYRQDLEIAIRSGVIKKIGSFPILISSKIASGQYVFENYQSYGVPPDLAEEIVYEQGLEFDRVGLEKALEKHQELSRTAAAGIFKGGLESHGEEETKLHTATHLLHQSLRTILGDHVSQKGSNITSERLRFDFSHPEKLTEEQIKQVEDLVNEQINKNLPVTVETMNKSEALKLGALAFFAEKYPDKVTVYSVGDFSKEICGGPHVNSTSELKHFEILKEESAGAGVRRIYGRVG